jgi:hydroxymethylglutaryl-CoA reductase (NADPH)
MASTLIRRNFRTADRDNESEPSWLKRQVTESLQTISRRACIHPIHTIVVIALLASTTYVGLLEGSLFDSFRNPKNVAGQVDVDSLLTGSRSLRLGESTAWKWQVEDSLTEEDYEVRLWMTRTTR